MALAKVTIIGNLGRDPELRYTSEGRAVCKFSVAVNHRRRGADGQMVDGETDWYNVTTWDKRAEALNQILTKGRQVYVEGRFRPRSYEKQDGGTGHSLDVVASEVQLLGPRPAGADQGQDNAEVVDDDIPF